MLLPSCNTNEIEDAESGALTEFGKLQKNIDKRKWLTTVPLWVDRSTPKEEGKQKSDRNRIGSWIGGGGGGRDRIHNI